MPHEPGPYVGLRPFQDSDRDYFKGRDADTRVVIANLRTAPCTILYGAAGVGKTSLLDAAVVPQLRRDLPNTPVVVFRDWSRKDFQRRLVRACIDETWRPGVDEPRPDEDRPLDEVLRACAQAAGTTILLLLDQFEEYLLYHPKCASAESFEAQLARAINREDVNEGILIAIREASLSQLDRFRERIPHLLSNTLRLKHLDSAGAAAAIGQPVLDVWNRLHPDAPPMRIDSELVEKVIRAARTDLVHDERGGKGKVDAPGEIEAPFLQLVMSRIWEEERAHSSTVLRLATYEALGGAEKIVQAHLDDVMSGFDESHRAVCATFFDRLVTPSGGRVPCNRDDLLKWAGSRAADVPSTLDLLSERRILRTVSAEPDRPEQTRYEIFHEVLSRPILNWRGRYVDAQERRHAVEAARLRTRQLMLRWVALALVVALIGWVRSGFYRTRANANRMAAESMADVPYRPARALDLAIGAVERAAGILPDILLTKLFGPTDATEDALRLAVQASRLEWSRAFPGEVRSVAFSRDGHTVAARSIGTAEDGRSSQVTIWNIQSGSPVKVAEQSFPDTRRMGGVAFVADADSSGHQILAIVSGTSTWLWRTSDRSAGMELPHGLPIDTAMAVSRDGRRLASAGFSGPVGPRQSSIKVWNIDTAWENEDTWGGESAAEPPLQTIDLGGAWVMGLAFSPDGCWLATAAVDIERTTLPSFAAIWSIHTGQRILDVPMPVSSDSVEFAPDGKSIALAGRDGIVRVLRPAANGAAADLGAVLGPCERGYDVGSGVNWNERLLAGHIERVRDVAFSPDGTRVASASGDETVKVWDVATGENTFTLLGHGGYVEAVAFGPGGERLASVSRDKTMRLWNLAGHSSAVHAIAFDPNAGQRVLATAGADRTARLWDVSTDVPQVKFTLDRHSGTIYRLAFDPQGQRLATASFDGTANLWSVRSGQHLRVFTGHKDQLRDVAFTPDGAFLATASADGSARLHSLTDPSAAAVVVVHDRDKPVQVSAIAMDPKRPRWVTAGWDGILKLWDYAGKEIGHIPRNAALPIVRVAFTRAGTEVAALSGHTVYFWPVDRFERPGGQQPRRLLVEGATFCHWLAFSADETQLAVACSDRAVRVYRNDAAAPKLVKVVRVHRSNVTGVAFSPDGRLLGTASLDRTFQISPVDFWDLYKLATRRQAATVTTR